MKSSIFMLGAAGLLLGLLAGRMFPPAAAEDGKQANLTAATVAPGRSAPKEARGLTIPADKRSFAALCRLYPRVAQDHAGIRHELERMDAAELRGTIEALLAERSKALAMDQTVGLSAAMKLACEELFQLDGEKALIWADGLPNSLHRLWVLHGLIEAANRESPELALPWIAKWKSEGLRYNSQTALAGAVDRGAEEVIRLQQVLGRDLGGAAGNEGFPDGFDFKRLISGMPVPGRESAVSLDLAIGYWAGKDRDAAWSGILEVMAKDKAAGAYVAGYFKGLCAVEGNAKAAADLAAQFDELPAEAKAEAFDELASYNYSTESLELIPLLKNDEDRVKLVAEYLDPRDQYQRGLESLDKLDSEALREQALISVAMKYGPGLSRREGNEHTATVLDYFAKAMERAGLSEESRARVEAALASHQNDTNK